MSEEWTRSPHAPWELCDCKPNEKYHCADYIDMKREKPFWEYKEEDYKTDDNCYTLPNGDCVSTKPCMHWIKE